MLIRAHVFDYLPNHSYFGLFIEIPPGPKTKKGISGPQSVHHTAHVKYNPDTKTFEGNKSSCRKATSPTIYLAGLPFLAPHFVAEELIIFVPRPCPLEHDLPTTERSQTDHKYHIGLPKEWEPLLKRQFGVEPAHLDSVDAGYKSQIPSVLVFMRDYLRKHDAFEIVRF